MKKVSRLPAMLLVIGLLLAMASILTAQQPGGNRMRPGNQQDRPQFDPAEMMKRRVNQIMEQLKPSEEEAALLKPMIENILQVRMDQNRETRELMNGLREAVDAKDAEKIKSSLASIKAKREEQRIKIERMDKELTELLTLDQEAALTLAGVVNSDGMGMGFFGGPRGDQPGGPGGQRQGRGNQTGGQGQ